ncbi:MAG: transglutaminase-like domain-containing protein [Eubacterium sp.]|nr:transglutaminase-like domain-containing protein [Eubacterium sp.]
MEETKKKNEGWKIAIAIILIIGVAAAIAMSSMTYLRLDSYLAELEKEENTETTENDVVIMDEYKIEATTQISDAYISGDTSSLSDRDKETLDMASKVLDEIITDDMSDFEKEKAVYDWMTTKLGSDRGVLTVVPSSGEDSDNPYGVLKYGNAVCVGYATTFRLFMQMMDIECMVVHNSEAYHSWDLVKIDDHWYHTDIYSDSDSNTYAHFNLNDSMMANQQSWDTDFFPAADSLQYNVAYQNMETFDSIDEIPSIVKEKFDEAKGSVTFCMTYSGEVDEELASRAVAVMQIIENQLMNYSSNYYVGSYGWSYSEDDNIYFMTVNLSVYNGEEVDTNDALTEEEQEEFTNSIYEMFSDLYGGSEYDYSEEYVDDTENYDVSEEITDESATDEYSTSEDEVVVMDEEGE